MKGRQQQDRKIHSQMLITVNVTLNVIHLCQCPWVDLMYLACMLLHWSVNLVCVSGIWDLGHHHLCTVPYCVISFECGEVCWNCTHINNTSLPHYKIIVDFTILLLQRAQKRWELSGVALTNTIPHWNVVFIYRFQITMDTDMETERLPLKDRNARYLKWLHFVVLW